jgi:hypothetical protein
METSSRELKLLFDAHEKRDDERFLEGKDSLKEALDDVSTAIQVSSREIMTEMKHVTSSVSSLESKVNNLELYRAGKDGSMKVVSYLGIFVGTVLISSMTWMATQIMGIKQDVQSLRSTLSAYNIEIIK